MSQALSKSYDIEYYWAYQDADDRLEQLFGSQRGLENGANFDVVQYEERASELMALDSIYVRRPELRKGARRLNGPILDHVNPKTIVSKAGYKPAKLEGVNLPNCWSLGAQRAQITLSNVAEYSEYNWSAITAERYGPQHMPPDMVRPRGVWVGVTGDDGQVNAAANAPAAAPGGGGGGGGGGGCVCDKCDRTSIVRASSSSAVTSVLAAPPSPSS